MVRFHHLRKLLLFLLLSASDLALTWLLVERGGGAVYEGNPVADWWLRSYGWAGLAAFKALTVLVVVGLTAIVSRYRPRSGGLILSVACSVLAVVVGYSGYLVARGADAPSRAELATLRAEAASIETEWVKSEEYRLAMDQASGDLAAGRCSLKEATNRLGSTCKAREASWLGVLHHYFPADSDEECLALSLVLHSFVWVHDDPAESKRLAHRLERELTADFGASARWNYRHLLRGAGLAEGDKSPAHSGGAAQL
jgi:hypothetical protein